jgi:hypothetical protein
VKKILIALLGALVVASAAAEAEFSIRFSDKRIYFPGDPVPVKITLRNQASEPYRFKLADDKMYSVRFELKTPANRSVPASDSFIRKHERNQPVFFREMTLEPGEEYSFIEDAGAYLDIRDPGSYDLSCRFYPELIRAAATGSLSGSASNTLLLDVRPRAGVSPIEEMTNQTARELLKAEKLPPDQVVERTIAARQKSLWNEFFLYLDIEGMYTRDPAKKAAYDRESDEGRRKLLERYKGDLIRGTVDGEVITVPYDFQILDTRYTPSRGQVRAQLRFKYPGYFQKTEYTYFLKRSDDVWYIYDYSVVLKGTE